MSLYIYLKDNISLGTGMIISLETEIWWILFQFFAKRR
jgi:hypothetical protein